MVDTPAPSRSPALSAVLEEHRGLRASLDEIRAALAPGGGGHRAWRDSLAAGLEQLRPRLEAHFGVEERSGLFEGIEQACPETAPACARLREEHRSLLVRLDAVRADVGEAEAEALRGRLRGVLDDLGRHEESEHDLLARALDGAVAAQD